MVKKEVKTKEKELTQEEWKLKFLKDDLEHQKTIYERYLEVLTKYHMADTGYAAIMADDLFREDLLRLMEKYKDDNIHMFSELMFGDGTPQTEEERLKENIDYYKKLIGVCKDRINNFPEETKKKIAKDSIEKFYSWLNLSSKEQQILERHKNDKQKKN